MQVYVPWRQCPDRPNGSICCFAIYDDWPSDEDAIGFARSLDADRPGIIRIIDNIRASVAQALEKI